MEYTREQVLEKAKERGYSIVMHSTDKKWYSMMHDRYQFSCQVYPDANEFKLVYVHGLLELSTGVCGSFMNDDHFNKFQRIMHSAVLALR